MDRTEYDKYLAGRHWARVVETTTRMAGGNCVRCGADGDDCHHTTYRSLWHEVAGVNVVLLCRPCHEFVHGRSTYDPAAPRPTCVDCGMGRQGA